MTYARQLANAKRIISAKGEPVTVKTQVVTQDPDKPWQTVTVPQDNHAQAAFFTVGTQIEKSIMLASDKPYPVGSLLAYMPYYGFDIDTNSVFVRSSDSKELRVLNIDLLNVNGEKLLFTIVFKQ